MSEEHINEIKAIIVLAIGMILFASLISYTPQDLPWFTSEPNIPAKNLIRISGAYLAGSILFCCGYSAYSIVIFCLFWSWNKFTSREIELSPAKLFSFLVLFVVISSLFSMTGSQESVDRFQRAGLAGMVVSEFLLQYLGSVGTYIILITLGALALILTGEVLVTPVVVRLYQQVVESFQALQESIRAGDFHISAFKPSVKLSTGTAATAAARPKPAAKSKPVEKEDEEEYEEDEEEYEEEDEEEYEEDEDEEYEEDEDEEEYEEDEEEYEEDDDEEEYEEDEEPVAKKPQIRIAKNENDAEEEYVDEPQVIGEFTLPNLDLLEDPPKVSTDKIQNNLINDAKRLEETLASFGVGARVVDIERGPAITRYELEPGPGVKVQKFTTLSNDIALAMKAPTVRIVAPIPGKSRVGIEVPNASSASVYLKEVLVSQEFRKPDSKLTIALGKDIGGKPMVADLAEMPHLLIAGTTGSGKSVCLNGIIMSILLNASPDEVRFVMVDPKMVELAMYNDIPHLLCPTVTDTKKASNVLNWVVGEMEARYKRLSKVKAKNIKGYNAMEGHHMHYIVVIIDELADLMQVAAKGVEGSITRLAQLSRAVGIHLILATQRPSVNVITGVIKANFPARISFKVASKVDSRTVLDMNGAESLLGKGDMLFIKPGDSKPTRGQGNFVKDEEITKVIQFIKDQQAPSYDDTILTTQKAGMSGGSEEKDEYYDEAVRLVMETNQASVSILQRRMRLGYTRAARLIDMMEQEGIIGPYCGSKPREILVDREEWLLNNMQGDDNE
ncbi:MAG: DNA translocase FtsK [Candidatus Omnitrophica bacterium]|nr:DNA translocase FtsK [Candidatus Omnitrophota bacterium]